MILSTLRSIGLVSAILGTVASAAERSLLLVSIDGLKPEYVADACKLGLKIPHLRDLWNTGQRASGVRGVLPTSTYPSHTTLITGVSPARHGIGSNQPFKPSGDQPYRWYWYTEDLKVPALWDAAADAGYEVASVSWPVTVGAEAVKYNIPDFTGTRSDEDAKMIRAWAGPAFMDGLAEKAGPFLTDVTLGTARDHARNRYLIEIIRQHRPSVVLAHFVAADYFQHQAGPFSSAAFSAIEEIDGMVGDLVAAMRREHPEAAVCIVSDHGFAEIQHLLALDSIFVRSGLGTGGSSSGSAPAGDEWVAKSWPNGGSIAVRLREPENAEAVQRVRAVLQELAQSPENGIVEILEKEDIARLGGSPEASFWVNLKANFAFSPLVGPWTLLPSPRRGTHGHVPTHPEMLSTFIFEAVGAGAGDLGEIDMRQIAPTLAAWLKVSLPAAELAPLSFLDR
jgi:predicted AlkP superfamily pyrophosphatase or phosphodiesterase